MNLITNSFNQYVSVVSMLAPDKSSPMASEKSTPNTRAVGAGLNAARHGRSDAEVHRESLCSAVMRKQRCIEQLVQRASCTSGCAGQSWLHSKRTRALRAAKALKARAISFDIF